MTPPLVMLQVLTSHSARNAAENFLFDPLQEAIISGQA